jgi:hypothetical protein
MSGHRLDLRVVAGSGGGPDKTILNSPRHLPLGYRMLCLCTRLAIRASNS